MAFNINAHVILQGPKNISAVTKSIRSQLQNINVNVGVNVPRTAQTQINTLNKQLNNLNNTNQKITSSAKSASSSVASVGTSAKSAANAMQVLGKETALTFKRFAAAGIVTATFFRMTQAISEAVPKALEFERGLTKLQQITGSTRRGLDGLAKTVDGLAKSFGKDANEILELAQIFAQTGQSIRQVEASVRAVARSSLAPTFGDMKQTAEGLVAALNQFGISARDSEKVLGSLNRVSKKFAVESDDLIAAIRRAGGVFAISAGQFKEPIDALNEFSAIFTAVRSTTRETAETVATGLRTIFSRIQRRGTIEVLRGLGIELTDTNGKFKGLFESFRILSKELDGLVQRGDAITLSAITEELGGIRQIGKLIPAIRNFNKAERAFAEAAQGASEGLGKDVAKGLEPLIVQFERVQQRFNSLVRTISDSSTFQALAKSAIGIANAFLTISESLTPLLPVLAKFAAFKLTKGAASFFQGFFGSARGAGGVAAVGQNLGRVATGQGRGGGAATSSLASAIKSMNTAVGGLSKVTSANTAATNSLNTTIKALQGSVGALNSTIRAKGFGGGIGSVVRGRGGRPRGFASGGLVPGTGNYDTVPAMLTPGEFVIKKSSVNSIGAGNLSNINKYAAGGKVIGSVRGSFGLGALGGIKGTKGLATEARTLAQIESGGEGAGVSSILRKQFDISTAAFEKAKGTSLKGKKTGLAKALTKEERDLFDAVRDKRPSVGAGALGTKSQAAKGLRRKLSAALTKIQGQKVSQAEIIRISKDKEDAARLLSNDKLLKTQIAVAGTGISTYDEARAASARLVAKGGKAYGLNPSARKTFGRKIVAKIPGIISSASAGMGKEFAYEANTPLSSVLDTGGLNSLNGLLFEAFVKSASRDIAGGEQNAAFDIMAGDVGKLSTLFSGYRNPTELKNLFADKQINSTYNKAVRSFGVSFDPSKLATFAKGGMASGTDTVPAMLTPGEFVINRKSAQSIGYGNLKTMNSGGSVPNGVKGYAAGGIVQEGRYFYGKPSPEAIQRVRNRYPDLNLTASEAEKIAGMNANQLRKFENSRRIASTTTVSQGNVQSTKPKVQGIVPASTTGQVQPQQATRGNLRNQPRRLTSPRGTAAGFAAMRMSSSNQLSAGVPAPGSAAAIAKQNQQVVKTNAQQTKAIKNNTKAVQKSAKSQARGTGLLSAAFFIPDLLFSIPLLAESFKDVSEGVEGAGTQLATTLLSTGVSAAFVIPALKEMGGLKGAVQGAKGALGSLAKAPFGARARFKDLRAGAPQVFSPTADGKIQRVPARAGVGTRAALRGAGPGGRFAATRGAGAIASGAALAATAASIVVGIIAEPLGNAISDSLLGGTRETISGVTGNRRESSGAAANRGRFTGGLSGAAAGAAAGFGVLGVGGAIGGAVIGGIVGAVQGGIEARLEAIKFEALVNMSDAAERASKTLGELARKQLVTANDIAAANNDTSTALNALSAGIGTMEFASLTASNIGLNPAIDSVVDASRSTFEFLSRGFEAFFQGSTSAGLLGQEQDRRAAKRELSGTGQNIRAALDATLTEEFVKNSQAAFDNVSSQILKKLTITGEQGAQTLGEIGKAIDTRTAKSTQESLFSVQKALSDLGKEGQEASKLFANNLQVQFLGSLKTATASLGEDGDAFAAVVGGIFTDPRVFQDQNAFKQAIFEANSELRSLGNSVSQSGVLGALNGIVDGLGETQLAAFQAEVSLQEYNARLKQQSIILKSIVSPVSKLTRIFEQAVNKFDVLASNASDALDSILSGSARFELDQTPNPFEGLDLSVNSAEFQARIEQGFADIIAAGGEGAIAATSGLENAPKFAAEFDEFLRDSVLDVKQARNDRQGTLPTLDQTLDVFRENLAASSIGGTDLADLVLGDIRDALSGGGSRQGGAEIGIDTIEDSLLKDGELLEKFGDKVSEIVDEFAKQRDLAKKIAAQDLKILELKRRERIQIRDLVQKNRDIDKQVGEITGTRKGTFAEADADIRRRIGLITGDADATSVGALSQRQAALTAQLEQARARERAGTGGDNIVNEIGNLEAKLADNTDALKTLAEDTTRLAAIQEEISRLQDRQEGARIGALDVFEKFGEAQQLMAQGDFAGAQRIFKAIRADFAIVAKLQNGGALNMFEASKFLSGRLNNLLTALGATPDQIKNGIDKGFAQVPKVLQDALAGIGVFVDAKVFAENLNMQNAIKPLKDLAEAVGEEQKKANQAIMDEIKNRAAELFASLTEAQKGLKDELRESTIALKNFKEGLIRDAEEQEAAAKEEGRAEAITRLGGGLDLQGDARREFLASLSTEAGSQVGFSPAQLAGLMKEIELLNSRGIEVNLFDILDQRRKAIRSAGFEATPEGIRAAQQSATGGIRPDSNAISPRALNSILASAAGTFGISAVEFGRLAGPGGTPQSREKTSTELLSEMIANLVSKGSTEEQALEAIAQATGLTAAILREEQGPNSFAVHDADANKKLDEQNKETKNVVKRFPPRRSAFDTNVSGRNKTAAAETKSIEDSIEAIKQINAEAAADMKMLENAAVAEAVANKRTEARQETADTVMNLGGGPASAGPALVTTMQDALRKIRQENRDPAGVNPLAGKSAEELQKMSTAIFEARRELIAFQKGLTDASQVTDQEVRDAIMRDLSPEERVQKVTNEMLEANMIRQGQFAGKQRQGGMQALVDQMRNDPAIGLQSDEEKLAAEVAFRDQASRKGIVSGRVDDQSRAAIINRQLEATQEAFDANQQRRSENKQRPIDIQASRRLERMAAEAASEENMRNIPVEGSTSAGGHRQLRGKLRLAGASSLLSRGFGAFDKVLADFGVESDQGLFKAIQEGRTSFGRFGTEEQEFSGLRGGATSRATTLEDQAIFLQDLFTREAAGGEKVDFDLLTADAIGIDPSLDPKKRKAALDKLNREEQNKRLSKITAAPGTAEFESQYEDIAGGGFFAGRNFLTKSQRESAEAALRSGFSTFDRRVTYNEEINDEALGGPTSAMFHEARRKQLAGTKAAAIARSGGAKVEAAASGFGSAREDYMKGERPTAPPADGPLQTEFPPDPGKATSMSSSAYETEQKAQAGLLAGVPGARGNFRQFGTGVRGRGSVDPQNYISGAAKKSIMRGKSFVTRAGSMGQYMDPRTGKTFNYDELSGSARKAIQLGTSKLVKKPTVKPETKGAGGVAGGAITPEQRAEAMVSAFDISNYAPEGATRMTPLGPVDEYGNIPGKNYGPQGSRPGGFRTPEEMGVSPANLAAALAVTPLGNNTSGITGVGGGYTPAPMSIPQGAGGLGGVGGIMGPDAVQAISSLAGALNSLGGVIELKITEPIEVRLDQGNLMGEIKKVVAEAVKNSTSSALSGNGSQMTPSTTTSPTPN